MLDRLIADQPVWSRFRRGWLVAAALLFPTLSWLVSFTAPGLRDRGRVLLRVVFGLACMACPPSAPGRWIALPGAWMLAEAWRGRWPFGGVPVSRLGDGAGRQPARRTSSASVARCCSISSPCAVGVAVAAAIARQVARSRWSPVWPSPASSCGAPLRRRGHDIGSLRVALVQGGGPQGTRFFETDPSVVFERHVDATDAVQPPVDMVLWPEDVVNIEGPVTNSPEGAVLSAIARRLHTNLIVGVVEGDGDRFHNAQVAIDPDGNFVDRYEKVRRVPFGEYVPLRWSARAVRGQLADRARRARSAPIPPSCRRRPGRFGVSESWEIFFPDRTRAAISDGGEVLLNPTNGASFHGSIVQTQQVAASRLAAITNGRWVLQAAPTGFTAIINADGTVEQRTGISERRVLEGAVQRRTGETIATRVGDWPALILALGLVGLGWLVQLRGGIEVRSPASGLEEDRDGAVVDEGDVHLGAETSGRDPGAEVSQTGDDRVDEGLGLLGPGGGDPRGSPSP